MPQIRQTRIFVPHKGLFGHQLWAETVFGAILRPAIRPFESSLKWYWFTRYVDNPAEESFPDCNLCKIPVEFKESGSGWYKSIRLRYALDGQKREQFEEHCQALIRKHGCATSDFRDYDSLRDLGGDRHIEEPRTPERRRRRAQLVAEHYYSLARLILDALEGPNPDGRFCLPHYSSPDAGRETPFLVFHHIFCNATGYGEAWPPPGALLIWPNRPAR